ncbi:hypothetical protein [Streptomyces sp. NBC_00096]|uniref:hypothetical protein n=1 Tax=Streptomyces sp. NBC_00096 TaxID=2975650 RepID=UPI00324A1C82
MSSRIDLVVGGVRAAELVKEYQGRLEAMDLLDPQAALEVACYAYATGCVHLLAAPGQVWARAEAKDDAEDDAVQYTAPEELHLIELENSELGHFALCREPCGIVTRLPLEELGSGYTLARWPQKCAADPGP